MNPTQKRLHQQLKEHLASLDASLEALEYSQKKCEGLNPKKAKTPEDQEVWEALTARFARTSDIFTQKVCKTLFLILQENILTFLDASHFLEKLGIVRRADDLIKIRELRNQISHEYADPDHLYEIFAESLKMTPLLIKTIQSAKKYLEKL